MSEETKVGHLKPETKERLKLCLEMASTDAIDLITEAENSVNFSPSSYASVTCRLAAKPLKHSISISNRSQNVTSRLARIPPDFSPSSYAKTPFFHPPLMQEIL